MKNKKMIVLIIPEFLFNIFDFRDRYSHPNFVTILMWIHKKQRII